MRYYRRETATMSKCDELVAVLKSKYGSVKPIRKSNVEFIELNGIFLLSLLEAEQVASGAATLEQIVIRRSAGDSWRLPHLP